MKERNPALPSIQAMEDLIRHVEQIGQLLIYLGEKEGSIEAASLNPLARSLVDFGHDLHVNYADALAAARGE